MRAELHAQEEARLEALRSYEVLDTPYESDFDDLVALAAEICGTPISLVSLVDEGRQWFKSKVGLDSNETPLEVSICAHAILGQEHFEIPDATKDPRTADNTLVSGPFGLRFYAGVPLASPEGLPIGTLCVIDTQPRELTKLQRDSLRVLGKQVMAQLELRRQVGQVEKERKAAQEASEMLVQVTRHFPMRVVYVDREMRYTFVNETFEKQFGVPKERVIGRTVEEVLGPGVFAATKIPIERALRGESHTQEIEIPYAGGHRLVQAAYAADRDVSGEVRGVICYSLDVTDQRALERRLLEERNRITQLMDKAPAFSALLEGPDLIFTYVNEEYRKLVGYRDVVGLPVRKALPEIEGQGFFDLLDKVYTTGEPYVGHGLIALIQQEPGAPLEERSLDLLYQAVRNPQDEIYGIFVHGVDVTEPLRAATALKASEERFRQLVDLSPSTVWFAEPDGGLSYISQDFYEVTGTSPEESLPHGWTSTVHPEDIARVAEDWSVARRSEAHYDTEFRIRHRDGIYRWISARAVPVRDAKGTVTGWMGSNSDIHEKKEMEVTLREHVIQRTAELQRTIEEAEGFNYSISHDLRAPLRAISSTSNIVLEEAGPELSEEHRELLVRQAYNCKRMGDLIDELLLLSRYSRIAVRRMPLDMTAKFESSISELDSPCQFKIQPGMTAEGDPDLIKTVLVNLVHNACKFSPSGGLIQAGEEDGAFYVRDQGIGFDMVYAAKIFLPFERLVREDEFPGTGIGLANVKRIIERHGGKVWVESEPGKGTTFRFTLA